MNDKIIEKRNKITSTLSRWAAARGVKVSFQNTLGEQNDDSLMRIHLTNPRTGKTLTYSTYLCNELSAGEICSEIANDAYDKGLLSDKKVYITTATPHKNDILDAMRHTMQFYGADYDGDVASLCPKIHPALKPFRLPVDAVLPRINNVIFNDPATIVFWSDGTKTVVKAQDEKFDPEKGLAMAISKKVLGNKGRYFNTFKKWLPEEEEVCKEETSDSEALKIACKTCYYRFTMETDPPCNQCYRMGNGAEDHYTPSKE